MGSPQSFAPEKLLIPVLISDATVKEPLLHSLNQYFGDPDYVSPELEFTFTRYYCPEMGERINRFFLSFQELVDPGRLAEIKLKTNQLEQEFSRAGRRRVNLDPGLLSLSRFVLASTKEGAHRIPLGCGIYAEVTLIYREKAFRPLAWTYPDYRSPEYLKILQEIRSLYFQQRRSGS